MSTRLTGTMRNGKETSKMSLINQNETNKDRFVSSYFTCTQEELLQFEAEKDQRNELSGQLCKEIDKLLVKKGGIKFKSDVNRLFFDKQFSFETFTCRSKKGGSKLDVIIRIKPRETDQANDDVRTSLSGAVVVLKIGDSLQELELDDSCEASLEGIEPGVLCCLRNLKFKHDIRTRSDERFPRWTKILATLCAMLLVAFSLIYLPSRKVRCVTADLARTDGNDASEYIVLSTPSLIDPSPENDLMYDVPDKFDDSTFDSDEKNEDGSKNVDSRSSVENLRENYGAGAAISFGSSRSLAKSLQDDDGGESQEVDACLIVPTPKLLFDDAERLADRAKRLRQRMELLINLACRYDGCRLDNGETESIVDETERIVDETERIVDETERIVDETERIVEAREYRSYDYNFQTQTLLDEVMRLADYDGFIAVNAALINAKVITRANYDKDETKLGDARERLDYARKKLIDVVEYYRNYRRKLEPPWEACMSLEDPEPLRRKTLTCRGVEFTFRYCPGEIFTLGSPSSKSERYENEPLRPATILENFWICETETTQEQWDAVGVETKRGRRIKGAKLPIEGVSWDECVAFVEKLNELDVAPEGWRFALPTEEQWEYACRAGTADSTYELNLDKYAWYNENSKGVPHEVGTKRPNAWGIYDMLGNVWEWTFSKYGDKNLCVVRGGSWNAEARDCRSANRNGNVSASNDDFGIRVVLVPSGT